MCDGDFIYGNYKTKEAWVGCPQDTRAEREARCTTSSDSTLLADSELVFEFCVRPHMTEKIDF